MNLNFSKSEILHQSSKLEHFQWWYKFGGGGFQTSQKFRFPTITIFVIFWTVGKNSRDYLEKKCGNIC